MTVEEQLRELARDADRHQRVITAAEIVERAASGFGSFPPRSSASTTEVPDQMALHFTDNEATVVDLGAPSAIDDRPKGTRRLVMTGLLVAAAVVAIVLVPMSRDRPVDPADQPSPTVTVAPAVPPRALFVTPDERFAPGTYFVNEVAGSPTPRIFITIGEGWRHSKENGAIRNEDIGVMTFSRPAQVFADACHANDGVHPGPVTSVDGLVAGLSEQGGWADVTAPSDISVDGYPGKTFRRTAPASFSGCTSGGDTGFRSWDNGGRDGGWEYYEPGETETVLVLDVNGTTILITSKLKTGDQEGATELAAVLESIRIEQA